MGYASTWKDVFLNWKMKGRFMAIDVWKEGEKIVISRDEYARSLERLQIRDKKSDEALTRVELKVYMKYIDKLN